MTHPRDLFELEQATPGEEISLPTPAVLGGLAVQEAIFRRRSLRHYTPEPLTPAQVSQLLWSAQGVTSGDGLRTAPSAGACYPLEVYLVCAQGLFHYVPRHHALVKALAGDLRSGLADAAGGQAFVAEAPVSLAFAAIHQRTTDRYGDRGIRYLHIDVGHAAQNVHLQAEALGLGSCAVGAFDDDAVAAVLNLPSDQRPVYIIPVGHPR